MVDTVQALQSLALSGTATSTITVPIGADKLVIQLSAYYAAVAATSGVTASFQYSNDGTTFVASGVGTIKANPAALTIGNAVAEIGIADIATRKDPGSIVSIKVTLTNLDATNAAAIVLLSEVI